MQRIAVVTRRQHEPCGFFCLFRLADSKGTVGLSMKGELEQQICMQSDLLRPSALALQWNALNLGNAVVTFPVRINTVGSTGQTVCP